MIQTDRYGLECLQTPRHLPHAGLDPTRASTGVVWCTERAAEYGFLDNPQEWANLGQGAPEVSIAANSVRDWGRADQPQVDDDIEGSFPRPKTLNLSEHSREYGPTAGIKPLREAVANLYNEMHRKDKPSKYTWENVAIVPGGRAGLIRIAAVLNNAYLGFFIPDYTGMSPSPWNLPCPCFIRANSPSQAYNEMLSLFKNVSTARCQSRRQEEEGKQRAGDGLDLWDIHADISHSSLRSLSRCQKRKVTTSTPRRSRKRSPEELA